MNGVKLRKVGLGGEGVLEWWSGGVLEEMFSSLAV